MQTRTDSDRLSALGCPGYSDRFARLVFALADRDDAPPTGFYVDAAYAEERRADDIAAELAAAVADETNTETIRALGAGWMLAARDLPEGILFDADQHGLTHGWAAAVARLYDLDAPELASELARI